MSLQLPFIIRACFSLAIILPLIIIIFGIFPKLVKLLFGASFCLHLFKLTPLIFSIRSSSYISSPETIYFLYKKKGRNGSNQLVNHTREQRDFLNLKCVLKSKLFVKKEARPKTQKCRKKNQILNLKSNLILLRTLFVSY